MEPVIFDQNYFIFQKNLIGRSMVACPNFEHYIYFSPFGGNEVRKTDLSPKRTVPYWKIFKIFFTKS
jgi:hypothetical protein